MLVRYSLEQQKARLGLELSAPLPLSSLDGTVDDPVFMSEMLKYEGTHDAFSEALTRCLEGNQQQHHVFAVTQASGSGKTKLAYAHGSSTSLMVLVRVVKQSGACPGAFETFE